MPISNHVKHILQGRIMSANACYAMSVMIGRPPEKEAPEFGKRVAAARKERSLTQAQMATVLGTSRKMVDYYERRATNVSADVVRKLAHALNISADELLGIKPKRAKPGPKSKLRRQIEQVEQLPKAKQQAISEILDMAAKSNTPE